MAAATVVVARAVAVKAAARAAAARVVERAEEWTTEGSLAFSRERAHRRVASTTRAAVTVFLVTVFCAQSHTAGREQHTRGGDQ